MSATARRSPPPFVPGYTAVPADVLSAVDGLGVDLFTVPGDSSKPCLLCARDYQPRAEEREALARKRARTVYVRNVDRPALETRLLACLDQILASRSIAPVERMQILLLATAGELAAALALPQGDAAVQCASALGGRIAGLVHSVVLRPRQAAFALQHDRGLFGHLLNVAVLLALLAKAMGGDRQDATALVAGGILHDFGKRRWPKTLPHSRNGLTSEERSLVQAHPLRGYEELAPRGDLVRPVLLMVYQHHERIDGRGYPVGIGGDEIHLWSRMCAVIDAFESVLARGPVGEQNAVDAALQRLKILSGTHLDAEIVDCWTDALHSA